MKRKRVKVCCISSLEEAELAIEYGADALGLVGPMPGGGPGIIDDNLARDIAVNVPSAIETFLVLVFYPLEAAVQQVNLRGDSPVADFAEYYCLCKASTSALSRRSTAAVKVPS